jgi:hypothetical protein
MYNVTLPRKHKALFPPRCVLSGGVANGEALLGAYGLLSLGGVSFAMPALSKFVRAPVRRALVLDFRLMSIIRRVGRFVGIVVLVFLLVFFGRAYGVSMPTWGVIVAAVLFSTVYTVLDTKVFPPPFRMMATQSTVIYQFRDPVYAREFMMLNSDMGDAMIAELERRYGMDAESVASA